MKWLHFILSHSIFISLCAAALCYQSYELLNVVPDNRVYLLVFCSTLSSYNLYWLISKYYFSKEKNKLTFLKKHFTNLLLFFLASFGAAYCMFLIPVIIPFVAVAVILTLLYSLPLSPIRASFLRNAGFIKTLLLAFTWTYVTIIIPVQIDLFKITTGIAILFTARFAFMLMLCSIFDSRDIAIDKMHSLRSLATDVSRGTLKIIMGIFFLIYLSAGSLLRQNFSTTPQVIAFFITGILVFFIYILSLKKQGYVFYYFVVDGLMLFSAGATYVASNWLFL